MADAKVVTSDLLDAWEKGDVSVPEILTELADLELSPSIAALTLAVLAYDDVSKWKLEDATPAAVSASSPLGQSALSPEEKARFTAASRQFVAALQAKLISAGTMDSFWQTLTPQGVGNRPGRSGLATQVGDAQLRALLSVMESAVQGKQIPSATPVDPMEGMREVLAKLKALRDRVEGR